MSRPVVDLVFRTVGERTAEVALELAKKHIDPDRVFILDSVKPFHECVRQQLAIEHEADFVVYVDADCLILEDLRPYLDRNENPYVDCYVSDRFRGRLHCGVHITRMDLVRAMAEVEVPEDDHPYVLRPESRLRNLAMRPRKMGKRFRNFNILHDHFQSYRDIFAKYALRELRSRTPEQRARLDMSMARWRDTECGDFAVARAAVDYAATHVPPGTSTADVARFIEELPRHAEEQIAAMGVVEKGPFSWDELDAYRQTEPLSSAYSYNRRNRPKIFGIGLSRTGTRSLTKALELLGYDVIHYPIDGTTFDELASAHYDLTLLREYDGITDITVAPFYAQLEREYPGSRFILTVRDKADWLLSCRNHWYERHAFEPDATPEREQHLKMRRLLRAAVYGTYVYDPERFSWVFDQHVENVKRHFADRPDRLLVTNLCTGDGWGPLCRFLDRPEPLQPFPHKGGRLSERVRELNIFD